MHFKLLIVFVEDSKTEAVITAARDAGATGCTVVSNARGEGIEAPSSFFGLALTTQRDVALLLVEERVEHPRRPELGNQALQRPQGATQVKHLVVPPHLFAKRFQ